MDKNYFSELNALDVSGHIEQKNRLNYLSWSWAWGELKKLHPDAVYTVYENEQGWNYHTDGRTCWVKTGVTVDGLEHIEYLPIMDYKNKSIELNAVTSMDVNKAIQRSITKEIARHGLGLYIYAGEDLPEESDGHHLPETTKKVAPAKPATLDAACGKIVSYLVNLGASKDAATHAMQVVAKDMGYASPRDVASNREGEFIDKCVVVIAEACNG